MCWSLQFAQVECDSHLLATYQPTTTSTIHVPTALCHSIARAHFFLHLYFILHFFAAMDTWTRCMREASWEQDALKSSCTHDDSHIVALQAPLFSSNKFASWIFLCGTHFPFSSYSLIFYFFVVAFSCVPFIRLAVASRTYFSFIRRRFLSLYFSIYIFYFIFA